MDILIDRKVQPRSHSIDKIDFVKPLLHKLDNGIPLYIFNSADQDLVKLEFIFPAGTWYQSKKLLAHATNKLISKGSINNTANQIAESFDFFGAYLETNIGSDNAYITLYCLYKHINNLLPLLEEIIKQALFSEEELQLYIQKYRQQYLINREKVNYIAKAHFNELIFGPQNPYGKVLDLKDFDNIKQTDLINHHKQQYLTEKIKIIVAGKCTKALMTKLNQRFGDASWLTKQIKDSKKPRTYTVENHHRIIEKKGAVQSAIRIGRKLFNKIHPDYAGMQVLNTILGGYFGSRLMKNIREEKGYTYGIGSNIISLQNSGYFYIATETGSEFTKDALREIYAEIKRIREEKVDDSELEIVKNYMMGSILRNQDGTFVISENYRDLIEYDLDYEHYRKLIEKIKNIKAEEIIVLSNKYLKLESLSELVVGTYDNS